MLADYHLHLEEGPLTRGYLQNFLNVGRKCGLAELGFSEHAYNFRDTTFLWPPEWDFPGAEGLSDYIDLVTGAKRDGLPVKLGIEMDYVENREKEIASFLSSYPWDYVIGSIHHIGDWGFDHPDYRYRWETTDIREAYENYFSLFSQAARSQLFDIMAHPDVIKVFGFRPEGALTPLWEEAAAAMAEGRVAVEINTAGFRKPAGEIYPDPGFLKCCQRQGVPIVISSDAHRPEDVGRDFEPAVQLAREVGYREVCFFTDRQPTPVPLK